MTFHCTVSKRITRLLLFVLLGTVACSSPEREAISPTADAPILAAPAGEVKDGLLFGHPIKYLRTTDGRNLYQGDIWLTDDQISTGRGPQPEGTGRTRARWPNNTVFYIIDPALPNPKRVSDAINDWEANTPLRFVQGANPGGHIVFRQSDGCSSNVGRIGGRQFINLADGCDDGSTIHEIGHAIGLWHEQSRTDRDNFITIHFENIEDGRAFNFQTYADQRMDGFNWGEFDFNSIMMYDPFAFSRNNQPTITRRDGAIYATQRIRLSPGDLTIAHVMYPDGPAGRRTFDVGFYRQRHADLAPYDNAFLTNHWLTYGIDEGRMSSPAFDVNDYLNRYADLRNAFGTNRRAALNHWLANGINEGRRASSTFDPVYYLANYADLRNAFGGPDAYQRALYHYVSYGINEGRKGSAEFDPQAYLARYPDLRNAFGNNYRLALHHWLANGTNEGRIGN